MGRTRIETQRLDDLAEVDDIDFLKIDIQGGELAVLVHGREKLKNAVVIQTELQFVNLYEGQPSFGEVDQELRAQGFIPHAFAALKNLSEEKLNVKKGRTKLGPIAPIKVQRWARGSHAGLKGWHRSLRQCARTRA